MVQWGWERCGLHNVFWAEIFASLLVAQLREERESAGGVHGHTLCRGCCRENQAV